MSEDGSEQAGAEDVTASLLDTLRALAVVHGHAEVYRTPAGEYRMTGPDCRTGSPDNRYVVAKFQLVGAIDAAGVSVDELVRDQAAAERVAATVLADRRRREAAHGVAVVRRS